MHLITHNKYKYNIIDQGFPLSQFLKRKIFFHFFSIWLKTNFLFMQTLYNITC
jgi:hypothetical protein